MPIIVGSALLVILLATFVLYPLMERTDVWLRTLLVWVFKPRQSFWKRVALWPLQKIVPSILRVEHAVVSAIGHALAYVIKTATHFLHWNAVIIRDSAVEVGRLAQKTHDALFYLRHTVVPALIKIAVDPVAKLATNAFNLAKATDAFIHRVETRFIGALQTLGIGAWATLDNALVGFAVYVDRLHDKVWKDIVPKLERAIGVTIPAIATEVDGIYTDLYRSGTDSLNWIRQRLADLEKAFGRFGANLETLILAVLASAAGIAVIEKILIKLAPNLFCRNTKNVTTRLCGLDEKLIEQLLLGTLAFAVVLDARALAREAQVVAGALDSMIRGTAQI